MNNNELRVVFKAVQDTSVKKVIDNIKGEVNSIGKATSGIFGKGGGSGAFWKLNPGFQQQLGSAQAAAQAAMRAPTMQNIIRNWGLLGKQGPQFPAIPGFMGGNFFRERAGSIQGLKDQNYGRALAGINSMGELGLGSIKGLRTPGGGDLAKVHAMGSFEENTKKSSIFSSLTARLLTIGAAVYAAKKGFDELKKAMDTFRKATENASKIYGKSLTTGLSLGFVQKRTALAGILGVSEEDVVKFSAALQVLSPKLEWATGILSSTNRNLTAVAWSFKILAYDFSALVAKISNDAAPAIGKLITVMDKMVKLAASLYDAFKGVLERIVKSLSSALVSDVFGTSLGILLSKVIGALVKSIPDSGTAPTPTSYMKQLGASSLERMGLIAGVGGGLGSHDPSIKTAQNTKKTAELLQMMLNAIKKEGFNAFATAVSYL